MKLGLDGTTTWIIYRTSFSRSLLLLVVGCLISGAAFRLALFPVTYELYKWTRLFAATAMTDGMITEPYLEGNRSYRVAYTYKIQSPDGTVQRFMQDEYIDEETYYRLKRSGMPIKVQYSVANPALARMADNTYLPWVSFFLQEILGLIFFIVGLWLVVCAVGAWVVNRKRTRRTATEVALIEQQHQTLEQQGYIRIRYQVLWASLFYRLRKYPQAARYIVHHDGQLYLLLDFIEHADERTKAQTYIAWLNAGGKPDPWRSVWLSEQLDSLGAHQSRR